MKRLCPQSSVVVVLWILLCICPVLATAASGSPDQTKNPPLPEAAQPKLTESPATPPGPNTLTIPGPLRSFERMAGISQFAPRNEITALLARNIWINGYEYGNSHQRNARPTEFLVLLKRYVDQARELEAMTSTDGMIRVPNCAASQGLLRALGYRMREPCGHDTSLETDDAERAFVTIDSGFPLAQLEEDLRHDRPFNYLFRGTVVPIMFTREAWTSHERSRDRDMLDALLRDPARARLYWAFSRMDETTSAELLHSPGLAHLDSYAALLDFYGSTLCIRSGQLVLPGGPSAAPAWRELAGTDPARPTSFITHLLEKDKGWPIAYFDVLSRISPDKQAFFTRPERLTRFYRALQSGDSDDGPARPVFRPDPGLLLLLTRLQIDSNGELHVPGGLAAWKEILKDTRRQPKLVRHSTKHAAQWTSPEQLLEALIAFSRIPERGGPLYLYMTLNEIDRERSPAHGLGPKTVLLMADKFSRFGDQYPVFSEFHDLNDASITEYLNAAAGIDHISNETLRGNAAGMLQAMTGLWGILARQSEIPVSARNQSWQAVVKPFLQIASSGQLFDSGRTSLHDLLLAATGKMDATEDDLIELLAGPAQSSNDGVQVHQRIAQRIRNMLDDQRLVSLDTLLQLGTGLDQMAQGQDTSASLLPLAHEVEAFEMPRPLFTSGERTEWTLGLSENRNNVMRVSTNLTKFIKPGASPKELNEARGALAPFFKNVLVGLNYAYYEPPGAQMIHNNALFVRSHDFTGQMTADGAQTWEVAHLVGTGLTANGGAFLAGSLADLPYVLSETEQNFIIPQNVQALIWEDLVPALMTSAVLPRWWNVSRDEMHAVALFQRAGEELLRASVHDEALRQQIMEMLYARMLPQRFDKINSLLVSGDAESALAEVTPADTFYLAAHFRMAYPGKFEQASAAGKELDDLAGADPDAVNWNRLSRDFGIPHPALAQTYSRALFDVKPFPALMGYSSRLMAECWDSSNLYWARLADEKGYSPVMLNELVPQLTRRMVEEIFASDFEDWPAVLRAMRQTGMEFREGKVGSPPQVNAAVVH